MATDPDFGWIIWPFGPGRKQVGLCFTEGDPDVIFEVPTEQAETLDRIFSAGAEIASLTIERDQLRGELNEQDKQLARIRQRAYRLETERDAAQALLVEEQRNHAATREQLANARVDHEGWARRSRFLSHQLADAQAELERRNQIIDSMETWVIDNADIWQVNESGEAQRTMHDILAAVDALGAPPPGEEGGSDGH
jgi:chromosome segregation ATPase